MIRTSVNVLFTSAVAALLACTQGPPGPQGERGPPGEPGATGFTGPAPSFADDGGFTGTGTPTDPYSVDFSKARAHVGWATAGDDVHTTVEGRVGIGTATPVAKLDVRGTLHVEDDVSLLPTYGCRSVTLAETKEDLGKQLEAVLARNRCTRVLLKASTTWTWNQPVVVAEHQSLTIEGEGYENGATKLTVTIEMTKNRIEMVKGLPRRVPGRVLVKSGAAFALNGVVLVESANDTVPVTLDCLNAALFNSGGLYSSIDLSQTRIQSSEDIINIGNRAFVNVLFGWTTIEKAKLSPRDITPVRTYPGWCFPGSFGFIHRGHTTAGTGVFWEEQNPNLRYTQ